MYSVTLQQTPISSANVPGLTCEKQQRLPMTWVTVPRHNSRARLRLFCFPYAGGAPPYGAWIGIICHQKFARKSNYARFAFLGASSTKTNLFSMNYRRFWIFSIR